MTNEQLYLAVGLPVFAMVTSLIVSLVQISAIKADIQDIRAEMRAMRQDFQLLTGKVYEMMGGKS
jgi:heme exporter protein D